MAEAFINRGKKIFFLYPHPVIRDMVKDIICHEFEVYLVYDHEKLKRYLASCPNSIVFINIEEQLKEEEWENYLRELLANPSLKGLGIGVLTYFDRSKALTEKYLMELGVNCGFIRLRMDVAKCKEIILNILEANKARGQRRFVRGIANPRLDTFNVEIGLSRYNGLILNISIAGMACQFRSLSIKLEVGMELTDIQLVLRGMHCKVSGKIIRIDRRGNDDDTYVILFKPESLTAQVKEKIYNFVHICLQEEVERELKKY